MTDLEKMARARADENGCTYGAPDAVVPCAADRTDCTCWREAKSAFDAALAAIRDPSPAVVEAMAKAMAGAFHSSGVFPDPCTAYEQFAAVWRAGIDAMMKEDGRE